MKMQCEACNGQKFEEVIEFQTKATKKIACRACGAQGYYENDEWTED